MNYLKHLINGKKVSIVGLSSIILGSNLGETIDKSDIVLRINSLWPKCGLQEFAQQDIGYKTDILFLSFLNSPNRISVLPDLKLLIHPNLNISKSIIRYLKVMKIKTMNYEDYYELKSYLIFTQIVETVIKCNPSSVYLCGVNFNNFPLDAKIIFKLSNKIILASHINLISSISFC